MLDANVLFPARLRDLFIRLAGAGTYRARWSDLVLDECFRNILAQRPDITEARLQRTRELMNAAIADATVTGFDELIERFDLPDPDDRHVAAAAVAGGATIIVTSNLRDFPAAALAPYDLVAISPDDFAQLLFGDDPDAVLAVLIEQAAGLRNPPTTLDELLDGLQQTGLSSFVRSVRAAGA